LNARFRIAPIRSCRPEPVRRRRDPRAEKAFSFFGRIKKEKRMATSPRHEMLRADD
jgi:hypothetical protein